MIRSILYLDEPKFASLSSQVLEGLTEYLLTERSATSDSGTSQKGPIASGRVLADALRQVSTSVERRVLHDHAFSLFEQRLLETGQLTDVNATKPTLPSPAPSLVRVSAPATFIDAQKLHTLLNTFNRIGEALACVTNHEAITTALAALEKAKEQIRDKAKLAELTRQTRAMVDVVALAKKQGMYQDPKFLEDLGLLTDFAFAKQIELHQTVGALLFSSPLTRDWLREPEGMLVRKYSRQTEKALVVVGLVTQSLDAVPAAAPPEGVKPSNMKAATINMLNHIAALESTLSGRSDNEVVIDPVAVYVTL